MAQLIKEYDTSLDSKHRITVRGGSNVFKNYHVSIFGDGRIVMEPRVLVDPRTLKMMDKAVDNIAKGRRSKPVDLDKMRKLANALSD